MKIKQTIAILIVLIASASSTSGQAQALSAKENEVIYHVFQRSFYDSNADGHGDLNGIKQKLDYLQELGITSIMMVPLYQSIYYHNYFPIDFKQIDSRFGSLEDYLALTKEVHKRGMKLYIDIEIHYVTEDHLWYKDSFQKPASVYSDYVVYNGQGNSNPESIAFGLNQLKSYDGKIQKMATANMKNKNVAKYHTDLLRYWADPNKDGKFDDGIDGFRIDHCMDNLDNKNLFTNMLSDFWKPMISEVKKVNPGIKVVAEQADWLNPTNEREYFGKGNIDCIFAFRIQNAIVSFNKQNISNKIDSTFSLTPKDHNQVVFLENHDTPRFASLVQRNIDKLKIGATLNLLIGGIPAIYYGQEIGMFGEGGNARFDDSDGNDIPRREAFEWYKEIDGNGMALWYKDTGPWWTETNLTANDGVSLEEQKNDPNSLWNFYKTILRLRKQNKSLVVGQFKAVENSNPNVLTFHRILEKTKALIIINLSEQEQRFEIKGMTLNNVTSLYNAKGKRQIDNQLLPFAIEVWELK